MSYRFVRFWLCETRFSAWDLIRRCVGEREAYGEVKTFDVFHGSDLLSVPMWRDILPTCDIYWRDMHVERPQAVCAVQRGCSCC